MYSALEVAEHVIVCAKQYGEYLNNLKLQSLLYFVQANAVATRRSPMFREPLVAWDIGPVVPEVYREYQVYGAGIIPDNHKRQANQYEIEPEHLNEIGLVVKSMARYSSGELADIAKKQTPWIEARISSGIDPGITIKSLEDYFLRR